MFSARHRYYVVFAIIIAGLLGMSGPANAASQASQAERDEADFAAQASQAEREDDPGAWDQVSQVGMIHSHFDAVFNDLDADAAAKLVGENAVIETPLGTFTGPDGLNEFLSILHRGNPDAVFSITSATVSAEGVRLEWHMSATSYKSDPNESAAAVMVERSGTATITFEDQVVSVASLDYETAISPLPSEAVAVYPMQSSPGQMDF